MTKNLDQKKTVQQNAYQLETLAIRAGTHRTEFNEHSEALFLTSSFVFDSAAQAAARFIGQEPGYTYSRFTNPTVTCSRRGWPHSKAPNNVSPPHPACRQCWRA